jgi:hypothetical protein
MSELQVNSPGALDTAAPKRASTTLLSGIAAVNASQDASPNLDVDDLAIPYEAASYRLGWRGEHGLGASAPPSPLERRGHARKTRLAALFTRPSFAIATLFKQRAQGMPGAGLAHGPPAEKKQAAVTTGSAEHPGIPRATALRRIPRSPWCAGLFGHHIRAKQSFVASATTHLRALRWIPASGYQDHTA